MGRTMGRRKETRVRRIGNARVPVERLVKARERRARREGGDAGWIARGLGMIAEGDDADGRGATVATGRPTDADVVVSEEVTQRATETSALDADGSHDGAVRRDDGAAHWECRRAGRASGDGAQAPSQTRDDDARCVATCGRCERENRGAKRREVMRDGRQGAKGGSRFSPRQGPAPGGSAGVRRRCRRGCRAGGPYRRGCR